MSEKTLPMEATPHMQNAGVNAWHSWKSRDTGGCIQVLARLMWEHMADAAPDATKANQQGKDPSGKNERYQVKKESGSEWARVVDTSTGMQVARYNVMPRKRSTRDGWRDADRHAERLNAATTGAGE